MKNYFFQLFRRFHAQNVHTYRENIRVQIGVSVGYFE